MLLMCKLVCQGSRRVSEDNLAIGGREKEGRQGGAEIYRKCVVRSFVICAFRRIYSSDTGRSDGAAYVACIGGIQACIQVLVR